MWHVLLAAAASASAFTPPRLVGDWYFGCDNGRYCAAVALLPVSPGSAPGEKWYALALERAPDADSPPRITISTTNPEEPEKPSEYALQLLVDGRPTGVHFTKNAKLAPGSNPMRAASLLAQARSAALANWKGETIGRISVDGAADAMRAIDDQQQRSGTVTALVATGPRPASAVPAAPALPRISTPPRSKAPPAKLTAEQVTAIQQDYECEGRERDQPKFVRLDEATTLAIVPCLAEGSQGTSVLMLLSNGGTLRPAALEPAFQREPQAAPDNELSGPNFYLDRFVLEKIGDEAAMGDCGEATNYVWDGSTFRLAFQHIMEHCRGSYAFIPVWRTINVADWHELR